MNKELSNISQDVLDIIERIVNNLAPYFTFSCYDIDDIKQEGRIFALEALSKFNKDRGELYSFLLVHVRNRLINLKRNKLYKLTPPCQTCKYRGDNGDCNLHNSMDECKILNLWLRKKDVKQPISYEVDSLDNDDRSIIDQVELNNLIKIIDEELPIKLRRYYLIYLDGGKIDSYYKNQLLNEIKEIAKRRGVIANL